MKRVLSVVTILIMTAVFMIPAGLMSSSYGAVTVRTAMPAFNSTEGKAYYYTDKNIFYSADLAPPKYSSSNKGYVWGNCTWYAYARASEMNGKWINSKFSRSASMWWDINKQNNCYPYGSTPKVGAIACYDTHVAVVEKVVNGQPYVSESGWTKAVKPPSVASQLKFNYGKPWYSKPKGYIYVGDPVSNNISNVNYSVKVTAKDLNMRMGAGTSYKTAGYIKPGTYAITQESNGWGKLASNGYWIALKYTTKVSAGSSPGSVDTGTAVNYNVKITTTNLNMRLGPATSYASKGYVKPGTYNVTKESNGWGKLKENGYWVALKYTSKTTGTTGGSTDNIANPSLYKVQINAIGLRMRTGPGTNYSSKGVVIKGQVYDIVDTKDGWGQIGKNGYWIKLSYTITVNAEFNVKVTAIDLNMRSGPSILSAKKGYIKPGTHTIKKVDGGWGQLKANGYWIKLSYTTKI